MRKSLRYTLQRLSRTLIAVLLISTLVPTYAWADGGVELSAEETSTGEPVALAEPQLAEEPEPATEREQDTELAFEPEPTEPEISEQEPEQAKAETVLFEAISDEQLVALGGKERFLEKFTGYLEEHSPGTTFVATLKAFEPVQDGTEALFELNDAALTLIAVTYTATDDEYFFEIRERTEQSAESTEAAESEAAESEDDKDLEIVEDNEANIDEDGKGSASTVMAPLDVELMAGPPSSLEGRFHLQEGFYAYWWQSVDFPGTVTVPGYTVVSWGNNTEGNNGRFSCMSSGAANWGDSDRGGNNRWGTVHASYSHSWESTGIAWYWVDEIVPDIQPAPPGSTVGVQYLGGGWVAIAWDFLGQLELYKSSANPALTNNNACYSLAGAVYGVYRTEQNARSNTNRIATLTTNSAGYAKSGALDYGTYYIKETAASSGYAIDPSIHRATISASTPIPKVYSTEVPLDDPVDMTIQKLDTATGEAWGQDDTTGASLAGGQFTLRYYDGQYGTVAAAQSSGSPTKTWIVQTKTGGRAYLDENYLISGSSSLYKNVAGDTTIPLGTVLIQETKAPSGYLLPSPNPVSIVNIYRDGNDVKFRITTDGKVHQYVDRLNALHIQEQPHALKVIKEDAVEGTLLAGAEFALYKESAPGKGDWLHVATRTTDVDGSFAFSPIATGSYKLIETKAPAGYQLPGEAGLPPAQFFTIDASTMLKTIVARDYKLAAIPIEKLDSKTHEPVADTEFAVYRYPVTLEDGVITADVAAIAADDPAWAEVARVTTDVDGKALFVDLPFGYYQLKETRPNPAYASYEESGGGPRFVKLDKHTTDEAQIFEDNVIQIACEVYKKTIAVTSSGLDGSKSAAANNVGYEEYLYHFGARSTSSVWADEFIVTDDLSYVTSRGYRMTTLWTGTSPVGMDFDNKMAVLYRTNMTAPSEPVTFGYNPLTGNPDNPNNPQRNIIFSNEPGWRIWAEQLSTTEQSRLDVKDLALANGEYIVGLKIIYGGVAQGFYTGRGWVDEKDPHTRATGNGSGALGSSDMQPASVRTMDAEVVLSDWYYAVVATSALLPKDEMGNETVMRGSVSADIGRNNGVLIDHDNDIVETRVIQPFQILTRSNGLIGDREPIMPIDYKPSSPRSRLPGTGDDPLLFELAAASIAAGIVLVSVREREKRNRRSKP